MKHIGSRVVACEDTCAGPLPAWTADICDVVVRLCQLRFVIQVTQA